MDFKILENKKHHLIDHSFELTISKNDVPFKSYILPIGLISLGYVFGEEQYGFKQDVKMPIKELILSGQFYEGYDFVANKEGYALGFNLKPTTLYKILRKDVSQFTDKISLFKDVDKKLHKDLEDIFLKNKGNKLKTVKEIFLYFDNFTIEQDLNVNHIDLALEYIEQKQGLLSVNDLLKEVPFSQKTLEVQFKKVIGLTPGKYIRLFRFMKLMRNYESKEVKIKDLLYMFNYYDNSHFNRDFKVFMKQSPKSFFKQDYPLIKKYLKE